MQSRARSLHLLMKQRLPQLHVANKRVKQSTFKNPGCSDLYDCSCSVQHLIVNSRVSSVYKNIQLSVKKRIIQPLILPYQKLLQDRIIFQRNLRIWNAIDSNKDISYIFSLYNCILMNIYFIINAYIRRRQRDLNSDVACILCWFYGLNLFLKNKKQIILLKPSCYICEYRGVYKCFPVQILNNLLDIPKTWYEHQNIQEHFTAVICNFLDKLIWASEC